MPPAQPVFVGRGRRAGPAQRPAGRGRGRPARAIAVIEGEAGLGKSSLITEFLGRHRDRPTLAASGEASEQSLPWGMVRQLARRDGGDRPGGPLLARGPAAHADPLSVGEELLALLAARSAAAA